MSRAVRNSLYSKTNEIVCYKPISFSWVKHFRDHILSNEESPHVELYVAQTNCDDGHGFGVTKGDTLLKVLDDGKAQSLKVWRPWGDTQSGALSRKHLRLKKRSEWTCEDVCEYAVKLKCAKSQSYYTDIISEKDKSMVRKKDFDRGTFVSYARKTLFDDLVNAVDRFFGQEADSAYIWMDIFCVNQPKLTDRLPSEKVKAYRYNLLKDGLHIAIAKFDRKVAVFDDWKKPTPLTRAWCVWEIFGVAVAKQKIEIAMTPQQEADYIGAIKSHEQLRDVMKSLVDLDVQQAECFNAEDLKLIHEAINTSSSFGEVNETILRELRAWHITAVEREIKRYKGKPTDEQWNLMRSYGHLLYDQGNYPEAIAAFESALRISKKMYKKAHSSTAVSYSSLGLCLIKLEEFGKAEKNLRAALKMDKKLYGDRDDQVAHDLNGLGLLLDNQGQYAEAEKLYSEALSIQKERLEDDNVEVATSLNNLGGVLQRQGKYGEALGMYNKALEIKEKQYGKVHPSVARCLNNIAQLYMNMGRVRDAMSTGKKALDIATKVLGPGHELTKKYAKIWG